MNYTNMKRHVLFDLDHTLSDASRRDHLIPGAMENGLWDDYHNDSANDLPCHDVVAMLNCFRHCDYPVFGLTARPNKHRSVTEQWLALHRVWLDEVLMRTFDQDIWVPTPAMKLRLAMERFDGDIAGNVLLVVDDRDDVAKVFAEAGVTSLQVRGRKY